MPIFSVFDDQSSLRRAIAFLQAANFHDEDMSILASSDEFPLDRDEPPAPRWLEALGSLAIPSIGAFVAGGPLLTAITECGERKPLRNLTEALVGLGIPEFEARHYELQVKQGGALLVIHAFDEKESEKIIEILRGCGGHNISLLGKAVLPLHPPDVAGEALLGGPRGHPNAGTLSRPRPS